MCTLQACATAINYKSNPKVPCRSPELVSMDSVVTNLKTIKIMQSSIYIVLVYIFHMILHITLF